MKIGDSVLIHGYVDEIRNDTVIVRNKGGYFGTTTEEIIDNDLINLIAENPELPIIPMVDSEVVADYGGYWMGKWGRCEVTEYYMGRERVWFKDDDEEDVLNDLVGCRYGHDYDGNDIYELSDDEWDALYKKVPWKKVIVVYITV